MGTSTKKVTPKKRGRPATGKDPLVSTRMPPSLIVDVDSWADRSGIKRSEAVRRLVELGLAKTSPTKRRTAAPASASDERAKELAAKTIDRMVDPSAAPEEKAIRKRRLLKGPSEFREVRVDRTKK